MSEHTNTDPLDEALLTFRQESLIVDANNSLGSGEGGRHAFETSLQSTKQAINNYINSRMLELRPNIDGINPNAKEYYAGFKQAQIEFDQRIAELNQVKEEQS